MLGIYVVTKAIVIQFLTVENDKLLESKEIYYIRKFNPALNEEDTL